MTELLYIEDILDAEDHHLALLWLQSLPYVSGQSKGGQEIDREQVWFQKEGKYFNPLWTSRYPRWKGNTYPQILRGIQRKICTIMSATGVQFDPNSCLVNYYKDGNAFIPKHKDNSLCFGDKPIIAGLSIGSTRVLRVGNSDYTLRDNSLFVMMGDSVIHELLPDSKCTVPRYSLTFREWTDPSNPSYSQHSV